VSILSRTGRLKDFHRRPGDPRTAERGVLPSSAQKWGARTLLSNFRSLNQPATGTGASENVKGVVKRATFIRTPDLGVPNPLNVQIRFAANDGGNVTRGNPVLPFQYPLVGSAQHIKVTVRRGIDPSSSPTIDDYFIGVNEVFPIDTITGRELGVEIEAVGPPGDLGQVDTTTAWVEAICSPVRNIGPTNEIHPWAVAQNTSFTAANPAATTLLAANSQRVQFFIVNHSTNSDLMIQLGKGPNNSDPRWLPTPLGTYVLPKNNFFVYESPCPCGFKGTVFGIWDQAIPDGGATVHEGVVF